METKVLTAPKEEKAVVYAAADGQEVRLTPEIVKKYLVQGKGELVTVPELMYFLNICRARRLNPLVKDCYLVKYTEKENAAIITSVDFFRKRARAQKDCNGWKKGVIVKTKDGQVRDSYGLVLKDEELVGGWFEAQPEGWTTPFRLEVNLSGYLKKTSEGKLTRFWQPENQPTMIAKVAEAQGLRTLWPDEFQQLYAEEEGRPIADEVPFIDVGQEEAHAPTFDSQIPATINRQHLEKYLSLCSGHFKRTVEEIKSEAAKDIPAFLVEFRKWAARQEQAQARQSTKKGKAAEPSAPASEKPAVETAPPPEAMSNPCPHDGDCYKASYCEKCPERPDCPAWSENQ